MSRYQDPEYQKKYYQANKHKRKAAVYDPEANLRRRVRREYDLSLEEYRTIQAQAQCDACGSHDAGSSTGWHLDHDHATGRVRGLLCHGCNLALGLLKDDPDRLLALHSYLTREDS